MKINEIVLVSELTPASKEKLEQFKKNSEFVTNLNNFKLFRNISDKDEVYFFLDKDEIIGYASVRHIPHSVDKSFWWLLELWIKDSKEYSRKGLGTSLVKFLKNEKIVLIVDREMTYQSFKMIKKMLDNKVVTGKLYNVETSVATEYTPGTSDSKIVHNKDLIFVLEDFIPRDGMLNKYITENYLDVRDPSYRNPFLYNGHYLETRKGPLKI